jgi:hypothetical protein
MNRLLRSSRERRLTMRRTFLGALAASVLVPAGLSVAVLSAQAESTVKIGVLLP